MAIKNKLDFTAFSRIGGAAPTLDYHTVLQQTKTTVKKLKAQPQKETPFFLLLNYFKNKAGKPEHHFFSLGEQRKLYKHFLQVEMKPKKSNQSLSDSPKEVAIGTCEVQLVDGNPLLYLYPDAKSKLPKSQWTKLPKTLKPYLMGLPVKVVFEPIASEEPTTTDPNASIEETPTTTENSSKTTTPNSKRMKQLGEIYNYAHQVSTHIGLNSEEKLQANVEKLQKALNQVTMQANTNSEIHPEEQKAIEHAQTSLKSAKKEMATYQKLQNGSPVEQEKAAFRVKINQFRAKIDLINSKINF